MWQAVGRYAADQGLAFGALLILFVLATDESVRRRLNENRVLRRLIASGAILGMVALVFQAIRIAAAASG
jgi:multisubunit Na+/H+ antiporter MnhB subunit